MPNRDSKGRFTATAVADRPVDLTKVEDNHKQQTRTYTLLIKGLLDVGDVLSKIKVPATVQVTAHEMNRWHGKLSDGQSLQTTTIKLIATSDLSDALNRWYTEDTEFPYKDGSLLLWSENPVSTVHRH